MMFPRTAMLLAVAASLVTANGMPPTLAADTPAAKDQKKDATKDSKKESKKDAKKESKKSDSEKKKADKPPPACNGDLCLRAGHQEEAEDRVRGGVRAHLHGWLREPPVAVRSP
ncbi:MAG: hypothetical protein K8S94_04885 [Planctomycetia bacterium]|nr:hypothetical protein [Planctomycetia bacterium]